MTFIFIPASIIFTSATVRFTLAEKTSSSVCTVSLLGNFMAVRKFTQMTKINKTLQKSSSIYDVQINNIKINVRENEHRLWKDKKKESSLICKYVQVLFNNTAYPTRITIYFNLSAYQ